MPGARKLDRCDICAINEAPRRPLRRFYLTSDVKRPDGGFIRRGVGSIILCSRCWSQTAGKRRRPRRHLSVAA
jgi:hypothetical protein